MNRAELKAAAKQQIKGHIGILFIIMLVGMVASLVLSFIPVIGAIAATVIISPALSLAFAIIYLNLTKNIAPEFENVLDGLRDFWSAFKVVFFIDLFTVLWSVLLIIPGIVKAISYSMSLYILAENKGMPALEAIDRSKKMMEGHKKEFFMMILSFLGWLLLSYITFGIALIWVLPYMNAAIANFYQSLKPQSTFSAVEPSADDEAFVKEPKALEVAKTPTSKEKAETDDDFAANDFSQIKF